MIRKLLVVGFIWVVAGPSQAQPVFDPICQDPVEFDAAYPAMMNQVEITSHGAALFGGDTGLRHPYAGRRDCTESTGRIMTDWGHIKEHYMQDRPATRLGGLAANLARIASFSDNPKHLKAVHDLLVESKYFIEWTTPDTALETQAELVRLQVELARWGVRLQRDWPDEDARQEMARKAKQWSQTVLESSGLLQVR